MARAKTTIAKSETVNRRKRRQVEATCCRFGSSEVRGCARDMDKQTAGTIGKR